MRSAYPLLVDQNGWSVGNCRDPTSLLRSVGVDLSRPAHHHSQHSNHDIEIHVEDPPSSFSHEYPQPLATTHGERAATLGGSPEYRTLKRKSGEHARTSSINRTVQRLQLSIHPEPDLRLENRRVEGRSDVRSDSRSDSRNQNTGSSRSSAASTATPRNSPRTTSPRTTYGGRRQEDVHSGGAAGLEQQDRLPNHREDYTRGSNGTGNCGVAHPAFNLPMMRPSRPSQLSLCCSSPEYYYNEERLRQEPEPGLLNCCDTKISCCPCSPCCEPYCPVGHMNTVCMSLICSGIILFIILSPLFHYLVPS